MKIYLAASISGGREFEKGTQLIAQILKQNGYGILTPFVVDTTINEQRFPHLQGKERARAIFQEDMRLLQEADVVIAEGSTHSTGLGIELGVVLGMNMFTENKKPTLYFRHSSLAQKRNTFLIEGNDYLTLRYYDENHGAQLEDDILSFLRDAKEDIEGGIKKERG